jgi:hypothetical protein
MVLKKSKESNIDLLNQKNKVNMRLCSMEDCPPNWEKYCNFLGKM